MDIDHNIQYQPDTEDSHIEEVEEGMHLQQSLDCRVIEDQWVVVEHLGKQESYLTQ